MTARMTSPDILHLQSRFTFLMEQACLADEETRSQYVDEMDRLYEELDGAVPDKLLALYSVIKRVEGEVTVIRREELALADARKARKKTVERLKSWMLELLQGHRATHGQVNVKASGHTFYSAKTTSLHVEQGAEWPARWTSERVQTMFSKPDAKEEMKRTTPEEWPDGFALVEGEGIRFR
jgi:hypothetical protein